MSSYVEFSPEKPSTATAHVLGSDNLTPRTAAAVEACGVASRFKVFIVAAALFLNTLLLVVSLSADLSILELDTPPDFGVTLTISYYMRGAYICAVTSSQQSCSSYTTVPNPNFVGDYYTGEFVKASLAAEGLVATAASLSALMALAVVVLLLSTFRGSSSYALRGQGQADPVLSRLAWVGYPRLLHLQLGVSALLAGLGVVVVGASATRMLTTAGVNSISWVNGGVYFGPAFGLAASGVATTIATAAFLHFA